MEYWSIICVERGSIDDDHIFVTFERKNRFVINGYVVVKYDNDISFWTHHDSMIKDPEEKIVLFTVTKAIEWFASINSVI